MAGVKGRSGGARPGTGGARPGAGRKPAPPIKPPAAVADLTPLEFLVAAMLGKVEASPTQVKAATAAAQYLHTRKQDGGKKEEQQEAAKKVAGRFSQANPPKLVAAGGKKV